METIITSSPTLIIVLLLATLFFGLLALALALAALFKLKKIRKDNELLFSGKNIQSLESVIIDHAQSIKEMDREIQDLFDISNKLHDLANQGLAKVGIIRFNPFKDIGGNQSFSIALLDSHDSGLVITSLHTRETGRVYAKPIFKGASDNHPLTEEERQAIKIANHLKKNKV